MAKPRIFLFYGSDSLASAQAIGRWRQLFEEKYGYHARYILEVDELTADRFKEQLARVFQGQDLFSEHKLVIIKRLTNQEKGNSRQFTRVLLDFLKAHPLKADDQLTLAIWEDRGLAATHPLMQELLNLEEQGLAKRQQFMVPVGSQLRTAIDKQLQLLGKRLDPAAYGWLGQQYQYREKIARLQKRVKAGETLMEDDRTWWLYQLMQTAALLSGEQISVADLEASDQQLGSSLGSFEVVDLLINRRWKQLVACFRQWEAVGDEGLFFQFLAAARWRVDRGGSLSAQSRTQLAAWLTEVELILKNFSVPSVWLFEQLVRRYQRLVDDGNIEAIIEPKTLWLAHLARS